MSQIDKRHTIKSKVSWINTVYWKRGKRYFRSKVSWREKHYIRSKTSRINKPDLGVWDNCTGVTLGVKCS